MYCECFTQGRYCDETCNCIGCKNTPENVDKIKAARKSIRSRNPQAFKPKVQNTGPLKLFEKQSSRSKSFGVVKQGSQTKCTKQANITSWHISGCKCKRSGCQKKYCECFQMGVLCKPDRCQCCDCKNTKEEVERRMANDDFLNEFADFIE